MTEEPRNNMALWDQVCDTNPEYTKDVSYGKRKFTAIDAYYKIKKATEVFGPAGGDWGWRIEEMKELGGEIVVRITLFACHEKRVLEIPVFGEASPGQDAAKKALTDAITKGLSYLGFSADVFLGEFEDNKYVQAQREKYAPTPSREPSKAQADDVDMDDTEALKARILVLAKETRYDLADQLKKRGFESLNDLSLLQLQATHHLLFHKSQKSKGE